MGDNEGVDTAVSFHGSESSDTNPPLAVVDNDEAGGGGTTVKDSSPAGSGPSSPVKQGKKSSKPKTFAGKTSTSAHCACAYHSVEN